MDYSCNLFDEWCKDYVYGNFPEIGQSALCVDLDDDRVFYEYDPIGKVEPKSENIVVISVYENLSSTIIDIEKRQMIRFIEREANIYLTDALKEYKEKKDILENEFKLAQEKKTKIRII